MDRLIGRPIRVIDGDTFVLEVTHVGMNNGYEYNDVERIRIRRRNAPERGAPGSRLATLRLRQRLRSCSAVSVTVHARDCFGRLVGDVSQSA